MQNIVSNIVKLMRPLSSELICSSVKVPQKNSKLKNSNTLLIQSITPIKKFKTS